MPTRLLERCASRATRLPRAAKAWIVITTDALAMPLALFLTMALKRGSIADAAQVPISLYIAAALLPASVLGAFRTYRAVFRFVSSGVLFRSALAVLASSVLLAVFNELVLRGAVSVNAIVIFTAFALLHIVGSRALVREWLYLRRGQKERIVIYGAGVTGAQLAGSLRDSGQYHTVAFVDRDAALAGQAIAGIRVHSPEALPELIQRQRISSVFLAIPSCSARQRQLVLKSLEPYPVHVRTVPDISDIVAGRAGVADLREVESSDLLERDPVAPDQSLLEACIRGKVVMVSGAGGSIGSELCRQILRLGPKRILLFEMSEPSLYQIDRELRAIAAAATDPV